MEKQYCRMCGSYLGKFVKDETNTKGKITGWYHYIDNPEFTTVGVVATAQMLILIKECNINISFDCTIIIKSLLNMQNHDGGWSYRSNILSSATEPTALSVQALLLWNNLAIKEMAEAVQKGVSWLLEHKSKACLWWPTEKQERTEFTYFSCVALRCLHRLVNSSASFIEASLLNEAKQALNDGCNSLLEAFQDSTFQCGWGETKFKEATLFHTAFSIVTLLEINSIYADQYAVMKSVNFLLRFEIDDCNDYNKSKFRSGMSEIYQCNTQRLTHTHSVDTYILLALLYGCPAEKRRDFDKKYKYYFECIEAANWKYQEFTTSWRLYDVVYLCSKYMEFMDDGGEKRMEHFKIALTFAGESRNLVEKIAKELANEFEKKDILYDKFHEAKFARPGLDAYLQKLYRYHSDLIVIFLRNEYSKKLWCGIEWRAIRDIINNMNYDKVMYIKDENIDINLIDLNGFYRLQDGYIDANTHSVREIVDMIIERYNDICINAR